MPLLSNFETYLIQLFFTKCVIFLLPFDKVFNHFINFATSYVIYVFFKGWEHLTSNFFAFQSKCAIVGFTIRSLNSSLLKEEKKVCMGN